MIWIDTFNFLNVKVTFLKLKGNSGPKSRIHFIKTFSSARSEQDNFIR